jgi:hypothetical protein
VITGGADFLSSFEVAAPKIYLALSYLRELTNDNAVQREFCTRLEEITGRAELPSSEKPSTQKRLPLWTRKDKPQYPVSACRLLSKSLPRCSK